MERIDYLLSREASVGPFVAPYYFNYVLRLSNAQAAKYWSFRAACYDRMLKVASAIGASYATSSAAMRLFDRSLSLITEPPITFVGMSILAMACFDIAQKSIDSELRHAVSVYHAHVQSSRNEFHISYEYFVQHFGACELSVLNQCNWQPITPSAYDYIVECTDWFTGDQSVSTIARSVAFFIDALLYSPQSTDLTAFEIAAVVIAIIHKCMPITRNTIERDTTRVIECVQEIEMCENQALAMSSLQQLMSMGNETGFYRRHGRIYNIWAKFVFGGDKIAETPPFFNHV